MLGVQSTKFSNQVSAILRPEPQVIVSPYPIFIQQTKRVTSDNEQWNIKMLHLNAFYHTKNRREEPTRGKQRQ